MKYFISRCFLISFVLLFVVACGDDEKKEEKKVECTIDNDCALNMKCNTSTNKCEQIISPEGLTGLEVDIESSLNSKEANVLIGDIKPVIAYGVYNNDPLDTKDLSLKVRWYSSDSSVASVERADDDSIKVTAKSKGTAEVYCKYQGIESKRVIFNVNEATLESLTLRSSLGDSIFLHQGVKWDVIATYPGGNQTTLELDTVEFQATPNHMTKDESGFYRFSQTGNYEVTVSKDDITSEAFNIEVKENVVLGIELTFISGQGTFTVNQANAILINELYEGNGKEEIEDYSDVTWLVYKFNEAEDGLLETTDYAFDGNMATFKSAGKFRVKATKVFGENTFESEFDYVVQEAK